MNRSFACAFCFFLGGHHGCDFSEKQAVVEGLRDYILALNEEGDVPKGGEGYLLNAKKLSCNSNSGARMWTLTTPCTYSPGSSYLIIASRPHNHYPFFSPLYLLATIMTKRLARERHEKLVGMMGMRTREVTRKTTPSISQDGKDKEVGDPNLRVRMSNSVMSGVPDDSLS